MKKVDVNIWEHENYSIIKKYSPVTKKYAYSIYKNIPVNANYQESKLVEIKDTLKQAKEYITA